VISPSASCSRSSDENTPSRSRASISGIRSSSSPAITTSGRIIHPWDGRRKLQARPARPRRGLRVGLLPQPNGFEGIERIERTVPVRIEGALHTQDPSVAERVAHRPPPVEPDTACRTLAVDPSDDQDLIAPLIDDVLDVTARRRSRPPSRGSDPRDRSRRGPSRSGRGLCVSRPRGRRGCRG
jgi:hypothetical protein